MADQTVKIERDDIAQVTADLAYKLWVAETGAGPKASDVAYFELISICNRALRGYCDSEELNDFVKKKFQK